MHQVLNGWRQSTYVEAPPRSHSNRQRRAVDGFRARYADRRGGEVGAHRPRPADAARRRALSRALGRLIAVAENYPTLKSNDNVKMLQELLSGTENKSASPGSSTTTSRPISLPASLSDDVFAGMGFKPPSCSGSPRKRPRRASGRPCLRSAVDPLATREPVRQRANRRRTWLIMIVHRLCCSGIGFDTALSAGRAHGSIGSIAALPSARSPLVGYTGDRAVLAATSAGRSMDEAGAAGADRLSSSNSTASSTKWRLPPASRRPCVVPDRDRARSPPAAAPGTRRLP